MESPEARDEIVLKNDATIRAAAFDGANQVSKVETLTVHKITDSEWRDRLFVRKVSARGSRDRYEAVDDGLQRGVLAYTGGSAETVTSLPDSIAGATLIRTSPSDAGNTEAEFLSFEINLPATLYLAFDSLRDPPAWLQSQFAETGLTVHTSRKGGEFDVYRRDAAAGRIVLPGNGGEGAMYQVYLSKAGASKTNEPAALAALPKANPAHGEEIFFGRGTCFACHQVRGRGIVLGPELKGINKRQDINYVVRSIIDPDAYIVEGFQQTSLEMRDGRKLFGMIQEETGQSVKIFLPTGERVVVDPGNILKREDARNSGMPASFAYTLSPQDVADVAAWIMSLD